jgi:hypothetical protein
LPVNSVLRITTGKNALYVCPGTLPFSNDIPSVVEIQPVSKNGGIWAVTNSDEKSLDINGMLFASLIVE